jgi:magnesium transporter
MRVAQILGPELDRLLTESPAAIGAVVDDVHPEDLADVIDGMPDERAAQLLTTLPTEYAAQVFERLEPDRQEQLAALMGAAETAELALKMDADERADFFAEIPTELSEQILERIEAADPEVKVDVEELILWPKTSAGGLMTTDYLSLPPGLNMDQVVQGIREHADDSETIDTVFIVGKDDQLRGLLSLRQVLLANPGARVEDVMTQHVISVPPDLDQEEVAHKLAKYDLTTMPVVDDSGALLGVITADDVMDVLTEEQSEDVHKMGAVEPIRNGYFDTSFGEFIQKRAPWLMVLFFGGFLATQALQAFEHQLQAVTQLAFYLPLLISAGGNSGSQSSTLIIRGLAVGDIETRQWWRVLTRETLQGLTLGGMLALFGIARAYLAGEGVEFATLIGVTVITIVLLGCIIGGMIPMLLHRLKIDPATSSTPFIATCVDVLGIVIYLGLARLLLAEALAHSPG